MVKASNKEKKRRFAEASEYYDKASILIIKEISRCSTEEKKVELRKKLDHCLKSSKVNTCLLDR